MSEHLTTSQLAHALGLADSTIRHYRASGRIVPAIETPGGHARYDLSEVAAALGVEPAATRGRAELKGLTRETFPPLGVHRLPRSRRPRATLPREMVALGVREVPDPRRGRSAAGPRWGGELLNARTRIPA